MLSAAVEAIETWWKRVPGFWRMQSIGWGLFVLLDLIDRQLIDRYLTHDTFLFSLFATVVIAPSLVVLSMGLRAIYVAQSPTNELSPRLLAVIALSSLAAAAVMAVLLFALHAASGTANLGRDPLVIPLIRYFLAFAGWSLCYFWIHAEIARQGERRHAVAAEAEALRAELEELRLQLEPHFLFNALNGVAAEIPRHPDAALRMLRDLTAYLRHSLAGIHQSVMTVAAEVEGLSAYLRVQQARFGPRLRTRLDVEPAAATRRIAGFLLQPLVENAIKYARRETGRSVRIDIRLDGDALRIEIENNGTLTPAAERHHLRPPIGLENVRRRLQLHYPGRHTFTLRQRYGDAEARPEENSVIATLVLEGEPCSGR